jgi:hypothetical protein
MKLGGTGSGANTATSSAVGYNSVTAAGSLLICVAMADADINAPIINLPITSGFSWVSAGFAFDANHEKVQVFYIANAGAMATSTKTTVTAHQLGAAYVDIDFSLYEFSGVVTSSPIDVGATTNNGSSSAPSTANLSTTVTDLIFVSEVGGAAAHGTGYTDGVSIGGVAKSQYILNQTAGSIATAFGASESLWGCIAIAFKAA